MVFRVPCDDPIATAANATTKPSREIPADDRIVPLEARAAASSATVFGGNLFFRRNGAICSKGFPADDDPIDDSDPIAAANTPGQPSPSAPGLASQRNSLQRKVSPVPLAPELASQKPRPVRGYPTASCQQTTALCGNLFLRRDGFAYPEGFPFDDPESESSASDANSRLRDWRLERQSASRLPPSPTPADVAAAAAAAAAAATLYRPSLRARGSLGTRRR